MKIERAVVEEMIGPNGVYAKPRLRLTLDDRILPKSVPIRSVRGASLVVHGRKHSFLADLFVVGHEHDGENHLNKFYPGRPFFPVDVNFVQPEYQWYIPLDRARKELAKHQADWRIVADDAFAVQGDLVWRLQEKELLCKAPSESDVAVSGPFCLNPATTEVRRHDYYIPLCPDHHRKLTVEMSKSRGPRR